MFTISGKADDRWKRRILSLSFALWLELHVCVSPAHADGKNKVLLSTVTSRV